MIGASGSGPSPTMRKSTEVRTVQEDFQVRVTPDGSNKDEEVAKEECGEYLRQKAGGLTPASCWFGISAES